MLRLKLKHNYLGFLGEIQAKRDKIRLWVQTRMSEGDPEQPPKKKFSPKFNLPVLNSYRGKVDDRYWRYWPTVSWEESKKLKSQINPDKIMANGDRHRVQR